MEGSGEGEKGKEERIEEKEGKEKEERIEEKEGKKEKEERIEKEGSGEGERIRVEGTKDEGANQAWVPNVFLPRAAGSLIGEGITNFITDWERYLPL